MSVTSTADYFSLLEKSGVLEDSVLEALRERYGELPDAKHLARKLVDRNDELLGKSDHHIEREKRDWHHSGDCELRHNQRIRTEIRARQ